MFIKWTKETVQIMGYKGKQLFEKTQMDQNFRYKHTKEEK